MHYLLGAVIGLVSGVTSGLFGVGGGVVMVPAMLLLLSPPIADIRQAIGTSLVVIIPTALVGSIKHYQHGNVEWRTVAALVPMALIGGWVGAWLTTQMEVLTIKRLFGGFIILAGCRLLFGK